MGSRSVSPGGALLRSSRMFSLPKPISESHNPFLGEARSNTATKAMPTHQSITSPLGSREKGDWGFKRPFPLKTTLATSTPYIRVKEVDSIENVTDFQSAADHTLSREKFQEMRIPLVVPQAEEKPGQRVTRNVGAKSVFEEDMDFTESHEGVKNSKRWKFSGPWLARMAEGDFRAYLSTKVRPRRAAFRALLRSTLAGQMTTEQNGAASEKGQEPPPAVKAEDISDAQLTEFMWHLRHDRTQLYALVSQFLDLAPLSRPVGFLNTNVFSDDTSPTESSPYGLAGPPPSHPSAGLSYLRTGSVMENHPVYGPQGRRSPVNSRIVYPRVGATPAKLGLGGFVATVPAGDNDFNTPNFRIRQKTIMPGIHNLDVSSYGGAKVYVEPQSAQVDPSGKIVIRTRETSAVAQLITKESKGQARLYEDYDKDGRPKVRTRQQQLIEEVMPAEPVREKKPEKDIVGSSRSYGLSRDGPTV